MLCKVALALFAACATGWSVAQAPAAAPTPAFGDTWVYRSTDLFTGLESQRYAMQFLRRDVLDLKFKFTDQATGRVQIVNRTPDLGTCASSRDIPEQTCAGPFVFPLALGAKHGYERFPSEDGYSGAQCEVEAYEKVAVPAGTFDAFRVACSGRWTFTGSRDAIYQGRESAIHWYAPAVKAEVKVIFRHYRNKGGMDVQTQTELVSFSPGGPEDTARDASVLSKSPGLLLAAMPAEFAAGTTRFVGKFFREPGGAGYSGDGRVTWASGDVYEGHLEHGERQGIGKFTWANGQRYQGNWIQDRPQGKGSLWFVNGDFYEGDIESGSATGMGSMTYGSGDRYSGHFVNGVPHGAGTYVGSTGQTLRGTWVDGKAEGSAVLQFANGDRYEGDLVSGVPSGLGRIDYKSGDAYVGTFKNGTADGEGTYTWRDGGRYVGQWRSGLKHGHGSLIWANGDRWDGNFDNDRQSEGTLTRKSN